MRSQGTTRSRLTLGFGWALVLLLLPTVLRAQEKITFQCRATETPRFT
jgi:hypothetical protein